MDRVCDTNSWLLVAVYARLLTTWLTFSRVAELDLELSTSISNFIELPIRGRWLVSIWRERN